MAILFYLSLFGFVAGMISFSFKSKYLLMMLMSLEYVILSIYLMLFYLFSLFYGDMYFGLIFLSMAVCESALALSLLVRMIQYYGLDYFKTLSVLW